MSYMKSSSGTAAMSMEPQPQQQNSVWHSPVPYLFGGLAAMLGLIAFALLILACSYWKLSGYLGGDGSGGDGGGGGDVERGDHGGGNVGEEDTVKVEAVFEEKIVVIMAGDEKPTFLATPISTGLPAASSINGDKDCKMTAGLDQDRTTKP